MEQKTFKLFDKVFTFKEEYEAGQQPTTLQVNSI